MKSVCPKCSSDVVIARDMVGTTRCLNHACSWIGTAKELVTIGSVRETVVEDAPEALNPNLKKAYDFKDQVNHPKHYNKGKIEVIEFIEDQKLGFHLANAVKYICRSDSKGTEKQDLEKAIWYIRRHLETLKENPRRPNDMKESQ